MTNEELFNLKNVNLFHPEGIEFVSTILFGLGFEYENLNTDYARKEGLRYINKLLELDLIEIFHWGKFQNKLENKELSKEQTFEYICKSWQPGANVPDFYDMPMFKYKNWYVKSLNNIGLTSTTNWNTFVTNKVGDIEEWIASIRPKS